MQKHFEVVCPVCSWHEEYKGLTGICPSCGCQRLVTRYDYRTIAKVWRKELPLRPFDMWRYWEVLPLLNRESIVTMGEGGTPLLPAQNLSLMLGCKNLYIKDERKNPTSSFKDRQASLAISNMRENLITEAVVASTGNVAISYAAYCARAGVKLWAFVTSTVPHDKMREVVLYGTELVKVSSTYDHTKTVAARFAKHKGIFFDRGAKNFVATEAMKTVAYEIAEQLGWRAPDWYVQSVSGGLGPLGVWKGFEEMMEMGLIDKMPKMAHIQASGCAPMTNSFNAGLEKVEPVKEPKTLITTVATGDPGETYVILRNITLKHGGAFETVTDEESFKAMHVMAQMDGLSMEPAAALACAGVFKLLGKGVMKPDEVIVINCSGHTFPVEKHRLDDSRVHDVDKETVTAAVEEQVPREGLLTALNRLDHRVQRVAIIEDDPDAARLLRRILQARGDYQIFEAHDGVEGVELLRRETPELVLLDLMMPGLDGFGILEVMKGEDKLRSIPVIVVTAKDLTPEDYRRLDGQVESLLQKGSFMEEDLLGGIIEALE